MNAEARQASLVLDSVAKAVANWTVDRHAELNTQLASRYGADWRSDWLGHALSHLHMLAQAIAVRRGEVFTYSVRWESESFMARGVDQADLLQHLECLRDVVAVELPPPVGQTAKMFVEDAIGALADASPNPASEDSLDSTQRQRVLKYLEAILAGHRTAAESMILATLDDGVAIAEIYEKVLAPAQERLGRMWHRGEISVADEHFGSATTQTVMSRLRSHFRAGRPNGRTMVATSTPGDLHEIGVRMVADLFELDGWNVIYLGANTPIADVVEMLTRRKGHLLALSVSAALTLRDAGDLIDSMRQTAAVAGTKVLLGGPPFKAVPDLWRELGADGCAQTATEAVTLANNLTAP